MGGRCWAGIERKRKDTVRNAHLELTRFHGDAREGARGQRSWTGRESRDLSDAVCPPFDRTVGGNAYYEPYKLLESAGVKSGWSTCALWKSSSLPLGARQLRNTPFSCNERLLGTDDVVDWSRRFLASVMNSCCVDWLWCCCVFIYYHIFCNMITITMW